MIRLSCRPWALATFVALVLVFAAPASAGPDCEGDDDFEIVRISVGEGGIAVLPSSVTIRLEGKPGMVCWLASGLAEGHTLEIAGKDAGDRLLGQGRFELVGDGTVVSGRPKAAGAWEYGVSVRKDGEVVLSVDPVIIIEGGGSGPAEP